MNPPDPEPVDAGWHPVARSDLVFRRVGEDWVLFDACGQRLHVLNLAAALVWSFCTGEHDVHSIETHVLRAFGDDVPDPGVRTALVDFREARLLEE
jgi:hypothetical protein